MIQIIAIVVLLSLVAPRVAVELPPEPALTPTLQMYSKVTVKQPEENAANYEEAGVSRQMDVRQEADETTTESQGQELSQPEKRVDAMAEEEVMEEEMQEFRELTE
ncbi:hypothetical protein Emed_003357 [Eimeria media]